MSSIEAVPEPRNGGSKEQESCGRPHHATEVEPEVKDRNLKRLRRIEGQVRGIQRMVEQERYCPDILVQIASIQEALRGVSREVMRNHLRHCAAEAAKEGGDAAEAMQGELLDLMYRYLS
ncbi:MAG: transcriptional regulator [Gemmatimonadales bacterium]|nr:MAG: transcriptional regulator [Gemmatimonadales bacterium]